MSIREDISSNLHCTIRSYFSTDWKVCRFALKSYKLEYVLLFYLHDFHITGNTDSYPLAVWRCAKDL